MMRCKTLMLVALVAAYASAHFETGKKRRPIQHTIIQPIPCYPQKQYVTHYVTEYQQVPVYVTQVVQQLAPEVVLQTVYHTEVLPVVVTQPLPEYVIETAYVTAQQVSVHYVTVPTVQYQPIPVSDTVNLPVTLTDHVTKAELLTTTNVVRRYSTAIDIQSVTNIITTTHHQLQTVVKFNVQTVTVTNPCKAPGYGGGSLGGGYKNRL